MAQFIGSNYYIARTYVGKPYLQRRIYLTMIAVMRGEDTKPTKLRLVWDRKRHELQLNQAVVAKRFGWSQPTISDYLNDKIPLGIAAAIRFSDLLEVPFGEIWEGKLPAIPSLEDIRDLKDVQELLQFCDDRFSNAELLELADALTILRTGRK